MGIPAPIRLPATLSTVLQGQNEPRLFPTDNRFDRLLGAFFLLLNNVDIASEGRLVGKVSPLNLPVFDIDVQKWMFVIDEKGLQPAE